MNPAVLDRSGSDVGAGEATPRPSRSALDTPEARARSVARVLEEREGIQSELRFRDAAGVDHWIRSCPVPGGRYLYDESESWGLRAIGYCRGDELEDMEALSDDYATRCAGERDPVCRPLCVSDVSRRSGDEKGGGS